MSTELKKASAGLLVGIFLFLLFGIFVVVWMRTGEKTSDFDQQRAKNRLVKLEQLQHENHEKLSGYAWVNKDKGVVQLPIERAQELVVAQLKAKQVQPSSVKVENPYPEGLKQTLAPVVSGTATSGSAAPAASGSAANPAPAAPSPSPAK